MILSDLFAAATLRPRGTTLEVESRLVIQLVQHEIDRTITATTENVVVHANVEQFDRTIRLGMDSETGTIRVAVETASNGGTGGDLFGLHHHLSFFLVP